MLIGVVRATQMERVVNSTLCLFGVWGLFLFCFFADYIFLTFQFYSGNTREMPTFQFHSGNTRDPYVPCFCLYVGIFPLTQFSPLTHSLSSTFAVCICLFYWFSCCLCLFSFCWSVFTVRFLFELCRVPPDSYSRVAALYVKPELVVYFLCVYNDH